MTAPAKVSRLLYYGGILRFLGLATSLQEKVSCRPESALTTPNLWKLKILILSLV